MGTLYLVGTPIGNLEDITLRALRILREVSLIAAEDTRQTRKLLSHYDIHTPLTSYYEHNKQFKTATILDALAQGDVALVSEAGMPGLSDPGYELVRAAIDRGYPVIPIPGATAAISALVASGLPTDHFLFLGFLPRKAGPRRTLLEQIAPLPWTLICYEAPHRLASTLAALEETLGSDRKIVIARELTKLHETWWRGTIGEARAYIAENPPRGEITLVIAGATSQERTWSEDQVRQALREHLDAGESVKDAAARVARASGWPRRTLYQIAQELKKTS